MKNGTLSGLLCGLLLSVPATKAMSWDDGERGSGVESHEERAIESFSRVEVSGAIDLTVLRGPVGPARLSGDSNLLPNVVLEQDGDWLRIYSKGSISPKLPLRVELSTDRLVEIHASGATSVRADGLDEERLQVECSGASDLHLAGRVGRLEADVSGASDLDAKGLQARDVEIDCSGASDGSVTALESLDADCSGAADIEFWGRPSTTRFSTSGASDITSHDGDYDTEDSDEHEPRSRGPRDGNVM